jgi:cyanophycinase
VKKKRQEGTLVIIGGAENRTLDGSILREFVRLSGGLKAKIFVSAVASGYPIETATSYLQIFRELGVEAVEALDITEREHGNDKRILELVGGATGVFFTGGSQTRITQILGGTNLDDLLHERYENEGLIVAGTSAGAAMMSHIMIAGGKPESAYHFGKVELSPGMNFVSGVLIDQHFEQRGRLRRLLAAVAQYPRDLGIGIDEDTAIIVENDVLRVIGEGSVTIIDAGDISYTNLAHLNKNDMLTIFGVKVHILAAGYRFDLANWKPLVD